MNEANGQSVRYWLKVAGVIVAIWAAFNVALKTDTAIQADVQKRLAILETNQADMMRRLHEQDEHMAYDDRQLSEMQRRDGTRR
jgi:prefoldin subunit 5